MFSFVYKEYTVWEVILSASLAVFMWLFGDLSFALYIIIAMTTFDFITGFMSAGINGNIESKHIMKTVFKICGYSILIASMNLVFCRFLPECYIPDSPDRLIPVPLTESLKIVPYIISTLIVLREGTSIVENLVSARIIPKGIARFIGRIFKTVREQVEKTNNE